MGPLWQGMQSCSRQVLGNVRQRFTTDQQLHHFRQLDCQLISVGRSKGLLKVVEGGRHEGRKAQQHCLD